MRDKAQKRDVIEREGGRAFVFEKRRVFRGLRVSTGECEFVFQWAPHEWAGYDPSVTPLAVRCYAAPADAVTHGKLWPKDQLLSGLGKTSTVSFAFTAWPPTQPRGPEVNRI